MTRSTDLAVLSRVAAPRPLTIVLADKARDADRKPCFSKRL
jgi:hypothetical protein